MEQIKQATRREPAIFLGFEGYCVDCQLGGLPVDNAQTTLEQAFFALEVEPLPARTLAARRGAHYCKHCGTPEAMPGHEC